MRVLTDDEVAQMRELANDPDYLRRLAADLRIAGMVEVDNPMRRELRPRRGADEGRQA